MVAVWCTVVSISPMWTWVRRHFWVPNQQRTLNKLPTELQRRNFVNNHRLGMQIGTKHAKTCMRSVCIPTELPFCLPPLVVGHFFVGCFPAPITRIPPSSFSPPPPPRGTRKKCDQSSEIWEKNRRRAEEKETP